MQTCSHKCLHWDAVLTLPAITRVNEICFEEEDAIKRTSKRRCWYGQVQLVDLCAMSHVTHGNHMGCLLFRYLFHSSPNKTSYNFVVDNAQVLQHPLELAELVTRQRHSPAILHHMRLYLFINTFRRVANIIIIIIIIIIIFNVQFSTKINEATIELNNTQSTHITSSKL